MAKRGRPRKSLGGTPPPPDRKTFEGQNDDFSSPIKRLRIEHLRHEIFEQPKIERTEAKAEAAKRLLEMPRRHEPEGLELPRRPRPGLPDPQEPSPPPDPLSRPDVLLPMTCAPKNAHFILRFKWSQVSWNFAEGVVTNGGHGRGGANTSTIPLNKMEFKRAACPACAASCSPILCGNCQQYLCDGGVERLPGGGRMHHCACGHSAILQPSLKEVSASQSAGAQTPSNAPRNLLQLPFRRS